MLSRRPLTTRSTNQSTSARHVHAAGDACSSSRCSNVGGNRVDRQTRQQRTGGMRHDPAWQIHSYGLLKAELASGKACASPHGDGFQQDVRVLTYQENLGNHHSGAAGTDNCRYDRPTARSADSQNPIAQRMPTAGSCMRGFRTPDDTRNPSPCRPFAALTAHPKSCRSVRRTRHATTW